LKNQLETHEKQWHKTEIRKTINKVARGILVYELIMFLIIIVDIIRRILPLFFGINELDIDTAIDNIASKAMNGGTSSIIAVFIGLLFLVFYFRKCGYRELIFRSQEKMTSLSFLILLTIFMSAQAVFSIAGAGIEAGLNRFGFSILSEIESASSNSTTVSMFLYASFIGPIAEEIVFRGFVMRGFQKYGTFYAIFMSAVIFGAFHGNLIQSIFATMVGFVLGYAAIKYSIKWSILLHIINNLIFGDLLSYLIANLNDTMQSMVIYAIEGVFFAGTFTVIIMKRNEMKEFIKKIKVEKGLLGLTFTSIWLLIFLAFQIFLGITGIEKLPG